MRLTNKIKYLFLIVLVIFTGFISLVLGSVEIPFSSVLSILFSEGNHAPVHSTIILESRFPRTITAMMAGAGLAISGLFMQTIFRNPLAGPSVLGISSGASLGVALIVMATGIPAFKFLSEMGFSGIAMAAIGGSIFVLMLVLFVASRVKDAVTILLVGLMLGFFVSAIVSILQYYTLDQSLRAFVLWGMGSFSGVSKDQLLVLFFTIIVGSILAIFCLKPLNVLLLGESYAKSMGIKIKSTRFLIILATGIFTGAITAFCGPIGFIGIAVPHLCRGIFKTQNHFILFPGVILTGAFAALLSDIISRLPSSDLVLPLNAVTSLLGAPVVIYLLLRRKPLSL